MVVHAWDVPVVTGYEGAAAGVATVDPLTIEQVSRSSSTGVLAEQHDAAGHRRDSCPAPAGRALVDLADELGDDVTVVVGHSGSSKASLLLGSTAHHVVHHVKRPVVVVRGEMRLPVRRAVVGVDKGDDDEEPDEHSLAALSWAVRLPGLERIEVSHADFVPGVAAGPGARARPGVRRGRSPTTTSWCDTPSNGRPTGPACPRTAPRSCPSSPPAPARSP